MIGVSHLFATVRINLLILYWGFYHLFQSTDLKIIGRIICKIKSKHTLIDQDRIEYYDKRVISRYCYFCDYYEILDMMFLTKYGWQRIPNYTENDYEKLHSEEVKFD